MDYPTRIMIPLTQDVSKALGMAAEKDDKHPKQVAVSLLRQGLGLGPLCPACDGRTFLKDAIWYCPVCNMKVALEE